MLENYLEIIDEKANNYASSNMHLDLATQYSSFIAGAVTGVELIKNEYENKLRWIPVEEKDPKCELQDEGIFYSKYLEIKVKGYEHPFIGFYVLANDDQFFDFIHKTVDDSIKQDEITHYRFVL